MRALNRQGGRKLDDEHDFVRVEIRAALERGLRVVPVLLEGTPMPRKTDLPDELHLLLRRQALNVDARDHLAFRGAMDRLVSMVREVLSGDAAPGPPAAHRSAPAAVAALAPVKPRST